MYTLHRESEDKKERERSVYSKSYLEGLMPCSSTNRLIFGMRPYTNSSVPTYYQGQSYFRTKYDSTRVGGRTECSSVNLRDGLVPDLSEEVDTYTF